MNKAQKLLQPIMPQPDDAKNEYSRGINFGVQLAFNALATLTDAITLADVPAVEWQFNGAIDIGEEHWSRGAWSIYPDGNRLGHVARNGGRNYPFGFLPTAARAKRAVEIRIHLADIERKLLAELAGGE